MSQQKKLEKVLDLLVNEDTARATELLHQIIVEKARSIYESIVDEEDDEEDIESEEELGGDENDDFTKEIAVDKDDIESDELNDGEASDDELEVDDELNDDDEDRIEDLEDQLAQLRAEFDALLADEAGEEHGIDNVLAVADDDLGADLDDDEYDDDTLVDSMYESRTKRKSPDEKFEKFTKANKKDAEDTKHKKAKVDEETQFTSKVADTGQTSKSPGFAGTGKHTPKGAEQDKSTFTKAPAKPSYGGKATTMVGKGTGGEYGDYNADSAMDDTPSDNVDEKQKSVATPGNTEKWAGTGKESGNFGSQQKKSPLSKAPNKSA